MLLLEATTFVASESLEIETWVWWNKNPNNHSSIWCRHFHAAHWCDLRAGICSLCEITGSSCSQGGWLTPSSVSQEDTFVPNLFLLCSCSAQGQVTRQRFEFLWTNFTEFIRKRAHIHYSISFLGAQGRVTPKGCRTTSFSTGPSSLTLNWVMAPERLCAQRYHLTGMRNWSITFSFFTE